MSKRRFNLITIWRPGEGKLSPKMSSGDPDTFHFSVSPSLACGPYHDACQHWCKMTAKPVGIMSTCQRNREREREKGKRKEKEKERVLLACQGCVFFKKLSLEVPLINFCCFSLAELVPLARSTWKVARENRKPAH